MPPTLAKLQQLEELSLEVNPIEEMTLLGQFPNLKRLNIAQTEIPSLDILKRLPQLKALNVHGLDLQSLTVLTQYPLKELVALDASHNDATSNRSTLPSSRNSNT